MQEKTEQHIKYISGQLERHFFSEENEMIHWSDNAEGYLRGLIAYVDYYIDGEDPMEFLIELNSRGEDEC